MIEFRGEFSETSNKFITANARRALSIAVSISVGIPTFIIMICAFIFHNWICFLVSGGGIVLLLFVYFFPETKKEKEKRLALETPNWIRINEIGNIEGEWKSHSTYKEIGDIKKIIDFGEGYYIVFYFPKECNVCCQKDLLTQGSIEEFEKLFEGLIVRKYIKDKDE